MMVAAAMAGATSIVMVVRGVQAGVVGSGELRCESNRGRTVFCPAPVQGNVVLAKQLSHAPCRYGDTWTFDRRGISVRDGCRAEFRFETRGW